LFPFGVRGRTAPSARIMACRAETALKSRRAGRI
jgi:hypothetical protein